MARGFSVWLSFLSSRERALAPASPFLVLLTRYDVCTISVSYDLLDAKERERLQAKFGDGVLQPAHLLSDAAVAPAHLTQRSWRALAPRTRRMSRAPCRRCGSGCSLPSSRHLASCTLVSLYAAATVSYELSPRLHHCPPHLFSRTRAKHQRLAMAGASYNITRFTRQVLKRHRKEPPSLVLHLYPTHFRFEQQVSDLNAACSQRRALEDPS